MANKTRINIGMPTELHEYVKVQAEKLGITTSTMCVIIVNQYTLNDDNIKLLQNFKAVSDE